jgi:hypothetical protein
MSFDATPHDDGQWRTGDVVIINLLNALENRRTSGKRRPAVLIRRENGHWATMGLTTNSRYQDGTARIPIPDPQAMGLRSSGWLWGDRLANISVLDIETRIGQVDEAMAEAIVELARLHDDDARALRIAARSSKAAHHG